MPIPEATISDGAGAALSADQRALLVLAIVLLATVMTVVFGAPHATLPSMQVSFDPAGLAGLPY
jgi:hypothetical protein